MHVTAVSKPANGANLLNILSGGGGTCTPLTPLATPMDDAQSIDQSVSQSVTPAT